jgi:regulator of replication initiation timing
MHIPFGTDSSSIDTVCSYSILSFTFINPGLQPLFKMGPITSPLSPATQSDILGILQREQDHAMSLLYLSPLLSSLFISYANRATALESASAAPSPGSEEWKTLQTTIITLQEENKKLKSENREMAEKLEVAEASQEAFRSQASSLKETNAAQQDDIKSLWAELFEAGDKYDLLVEVSNAEKSGLQAQILDLEVRLEPCLIVD